MTVELDMGCDRELGVEYLDLTAEGGWARVRIKDKLLQPWRIVHGGVYCSIVEGLASISEKNFLRAISAGTVTAVSTPIHRGRRQQVWLVTITDDNDRVVARGQVRLQNIPPE
jgi:1,4-dihydroxy-2-naphthoyl-CoA hydrolase